MVKIIVSSSIVVKETTERSRAYVQFLIPGNSTNMSRVEFPEGTAGFGQERNLEDFEYRQILRGEENQDELVQETQIRLWFVVPVLVCATIAISAAGAITKLMTNAAPISQAGWRLQLTSVILLPGFLWQFCRMTKEEREQCSLWRNVGVLFLSAISLAFHFGLWIWSIDHTSLPHSLLLVSMPPVIVAALAYLQGKPLARGEMIGVALGVGGAIIIAGGSKLENDVEVTMLGDIAAFLAAVTFVAYISAGVHLRGWMPLYVYAFPVTAGAAVVLTLAGVTFEGVEFSSSGEISGPFSWLKKEYLLLNLALALGPGFVGHTGFNAVLRHCTALLVAMATTVEPLLGSIMAWALNVSGVPGLWTCLGGTVMLIGTLWVSYASEQNKDEVNREGNAEAGEDGGLASKQEEEGHAKRWRWRILLQSSDLQ